MLMPGGRKFKRPGTPQFNMGEDEKRLKTEGNEVAPIVPTSNMRIAAAKQAASTPPPSGGGKMSAQSVGQTSQALNTTTPTAATSGGNPRFNTQAGLAPAPGPKADPGAGVADQTEAAKQAALMALLENQPVINTAEDEAIIQQMLTNQVGGQNRDLSARFGASGGGSSGALYQAQEDMRVRAALQAANRIMGVRNDARDDWYRNVNAGIGGTEADRSGDIREDQANADIQNDNAAMNPNFQDNDGNGFDDFTGLSLEQSQASDYVSGIAGTDGIYWMGTAGTEANPIGLDPRQGEALARSGAEYIRTDMWGTKIYYNPQTGAYYGVKAR